MDSTELKNRLQVLADEAGPTDLGTCLTTVLGALKNGKIEELSNIMLQFTIDTVGELVKGDPQGQEMFRKVLRDSLKEAMGLE